MGDEQKRNAFDFMLNRSKPSQNAHDDRDDIRDLDDRDHEHRDHDDFDAFIFGKNREKDRSEGRSPDIPEGSSGQLDWSEMFYHVDTLIDSARELKPLFSKVKPFLDSFLDKKKS